MQASGIDRNRSTLNRSMWMGIYLLGLLGIILALYMATMKIDYVWRWNILPKYFYNRAQIHISAKVEGTVASIKIENNTAMVELKSSDGSTEKYTIPSSDVWVSEGDTIYPGDTLGTYEKWRPGLLTQGLYLTLKISLYSIAFGIIIGMIGGVARISTNPAAKWAAMTYVELIRGSPLLVQIFIWYFVLATMVNQLLSKYGIPEISAMWYGIAALACFTGAYVTEIVRAGIQSIHRGQIEAARSLGMTGFQSLQHIILPQAMRRILPPLAGQFISLIKDSSLLGIIAIRELTKATREGITASLQPYEFWFTCAILYLVLTFTLSMFVQYLEIRMNTK